ncbi:DUF1471 domain-containing protein [Scandinavium goeteborgense]|uniref:DUF1471 domain-containing protein n=1 Tax=Scandinavium goeteborgense TaxID=1851514 RepID=UPI000F6654A7|nr:DUF1471 domain-containing protein [Scandinavium goeteborgense]QKN83624.1 DUF1471 domain-containing protein [Scandinavium goeteborgense]
MMINKTFIFAALMTASTLSFASTEIRDSQMADMNQKIGNISVNVKNGTFEEAMAALSKKADQKGAGHYHITSLERTGMSADIRATAIIYK